MSLSPAKIENELMHIQIFYVEYCTKYTFTYIYVENNRRIEKENENGMNE